jgi:hypothetical protein
MTLGIRVPGIITHGMMTLRIMTLRIMALSRTLTNIKNTLR